MTTPNEELRALHTNVLGDLRERLISRGSAVWTVDRTAALDYAIAALARQEEGQPAPASPQGVSEDYRQIAHLIGSIFFAGGFKAETLNERELESLLIKTGHRYRSWDEVEAGTAAGAAQEPAGGATPTPQAEPAGGGEAMAWQYRWRQEGPCACTYNTFRHPINDMRMDPKSIDWWVYGVKPTTPTPQAADAEEWEVRADGQRVRKDRWETGFRNIVGILVGARTEFEIPDIVERVRVLASASSTPQAAGVSDLTLPYEQALSALIDLIVPDLDSGNILADAHTAMKALNEGAAELTTTYVQPVPDKCDRIIWRRRYFHLPETLDGNVTAAGSAPEGWQAKAHELLDRLTKASPPNVLHQQLTILGDMAALLRCMYPQQPGAQHGQEGRDG